MTPAEVLRLGPWFTEKERYVSGLPVEWATVNFKTMLGMKTLREQLGSPIHLIRGPHPNRPEAVDACCPALSLRRVFMELCRLPHCSWGLYSGNSFHLDTRDYVDAPARWLAVRTSERSELSARGFKNVITAERNGWLYLPWSHASSWDLLALVLALSDLKKASPKSSLT